jgi:hypothetical protein
MMILTNVPRGLLAALALCFTAGGALAAPVAEPAPIDWEKEWQSQLNHIATQIETRRQMRFRGDGEVYHNQQAAILESDRTPVDVILRRSQALLDYLQENGPLQGGELVKAGIN